MKFETIWQKPRPLSTRKSGQILREAAHSLMGRVALETAESALVETIGDAQFVLMGEASHGTHEFYEMRARLTRRLMQEKGFRILAVEADWPDMQRVDSFIRGISPGTAEDALGGFTRFPRWMWRNQVIQEFVEWMRDFNGQNAQRPARIYGLDLYSLHASMAAVVAFLEKSDPAAARRAKARYGCFDSFGATPQLYGLAATRGLGSCEGAVIEQLVELQQRTAAKVEGNGEEAFFARQNARLVKNAEEYYRSMFGDDAVSWNLRDQHMVETLESILEHHQDSKAILWAHNSHLGDARATEMADRGEFNVGQLMRERYGPDCFTLGFSTYSGTVTAARDWDHPPERRNVRPALAGSYEALLHIVGGQFWLNLHPEEPVADLLREPRLERAIGVIYRPETERRSHYFYSVLPEQFDAVAHFDHSRALDPLDRNEKWERGELPETYPSAL